MSPRSGRGRARRPPRSTAAAPANWSVDSGSTQQRNPRRQRFGDAVVAAVRHRDGRVREEPDLWEELAHEPLLRQRAEEVTGRGPGREGHPHVEPPQCLGDDGQHVGAGRQEAAEADVDDRPVVSGEPALHLGVRGLLAHRRAEEGVGGQQRRALGVVEPLRVVEQQQVAGLGEGVGAGRGRRVEHGERRVPLRREGVPDVDAQRSELGERARVGADAPRPGRRVAVDLVSDGERRRVPEHDVGVRDPRAHQTQPGAEGQVVDEHGVRAHPRRRGRAPLRPPRPRSRAGRHRGRAPGTPTPRRRRPGWPRRTRAASRPRPGAAPRRGSPRGSSPGRAGGVRARSRTRGPPRRWRGPSRRRRARPRPARRWRGWPGGSRCEA